MQPELTAGGINRGIREIRGKQPSFRFAFRVFGVFRGCYRRGNCSQAANHLIYCRAEKRLRLEISGLIASLRFMVRSVLVAALPRRAFVVHTLLRRQGSDIKGLTTLAIRLWVPLCARCIAGAAPVQARCRPGEYLTWVA
jgi:hypothetical protein